MSSLPELLIHIGAGKTGSTSIQFTLKNAREALLAQHTAYAGLVLEYVQGARKYDWCTEGAPQKFFKSDDSKRTKDEIYSVLRDGLERYAARGVRKVIWSNEAFLTRRDHVLDVVQRLAQDGVPIRLIAYVRRHDKWARSGYVQFGIKYKTYPGPLRTFAEWVNSQDIGYLHSLEAWRKAFPGKLEIYNFDTAGDVVTHFMDKAGLEGIEVVRANDSPSNALLAVWAAFNNRSEAPILPNAFMRMAKPLKILTSRYSLSPPIEELLPSAAQLVAVQERYRMDLERVNRLLAENGEPPMVFDAPDEKSRTATTWEIDHMLLQMVFSLQKQVSDLQEEVETLKKQKDFV